MKTTMLKVALNILLISVLGLLPAQNVPLKLEWSKRLPTASLLPSNYSLFKVPLFTPNDLFEEEEGYLLSFRMHFNNIGHLEMETFQIEGDLSRITPFVFTAERSAAFDLYSSKDGYGALWIEMEDFKVLEYGQEVPMLLYTTSIDPYGMERGESKSAVLKDKFSIHAGYFVYETSENGKYTLFLSVFQESPKEWSYQCTLLSQEEGEVWTQEYTQRTNLNLVQMPQAYVTDSGQVLLLFERKGTSETPSRAQATGPRLLSFTEKSSEPEIRDLRMGVYYLHGSKIVEVEEDQAKIIGVAGIKGFQQFDGVMQATLDLHTLEVTHSSFTNVSNNIVGESYLPDFNGRINLGNWYEGEDGTLSLLFQRYKDVGGKIYHEGILLMEISAGNEVQMHRFLPFYAKFPYSSNLLGLRSAKVDAIAKGSFEAAYSTQITEKGFYLLGGFNLAKAGWDPTKKPRLSTMAEEDTYMVHVDRQGEVSSQKVFSYEDEGGTVFFAPAYFGPKGGNEMLFLCQDSKTVRVGKVSWE